MTDWDGTGENAIILVTGLREQIYTVVDWCRLAPQLFVQHDWGWARKVYPPSHWIDSLHDANLPHQCHCTAVWEMTFLGEREMCKIWLLFYRYETIEMKQVFTHIDTAFTVFYCAELAVHMWSRWFWEFFRLMWLLQALLCWVLLVFMFSLSWLFQHLRWNSYNLDVCCSINSCVCLRFLSHSSARWCKHRSCTVDFVCTFYILLIPTYCWYEVLFKSKPCRDWWCIFDFIVVVASIIDAIMLEVAGETSCPCS